MEISIFGKYVSFMYIIVRQLLFILSLDFIVLFNSFGQERDSTFINHPLINLNPFPEKLHSLNNNKISTSCFFDQKISVLVFLAPDCPICRNYSLTLNEISDKYRNRGIRVFGIFSGKRFTKKEIKEYVSKYNINFEVLLDVDYQLAKYYDATITPEIFVLTQKRQVEYTGKIDNWVYGLGKKRSFPTEFYLIDALESLIFDKQILIPKTQPIGCFLFSF